MSNPHSLHIYGMVRFYRNGAEPEESNWNEDHSLLADHVLKHVPEDGGSSLDEDAFGYQIIVFPSPALCPVRWKTAYNTATQCMTCCRTLHESGDSFMPEELSAMTGPAMELGTKILQELIHENHPQVVACEDRPPNIDFYGIVRSTPKG